MLAITKQKPTVADRVKTKTAFLRKLSGLLRDEGAPCHPPTPRYARLYHVKSQARDNEVTIVISRESGPLFVLGYAPDTGACFKDAWISYRRTIRRTKHNQVFQEHLTRVVRAYLQHDSTDITWVH